MISFRIALPSDLQTVFSLICELESSGDETMDFDAFALVYLKNCEDPGTYYLLAEEEGETLGFGSMHVQQLLHHCGPVAEVQELIVAENSRGGGVGKQLLAALEDEAKLRGCRQIELCCNMKRLESNEFYGRRGYKKTHFKHVKKFV
jgi:PhnO protein